MPTAQYTGCAKQDTNYLPDETVKRPCDSRRIKGRRITDSPASSRRFANFIALRLFHVYCLTFIAPRLLLHVYCFTSVEAISSVSMNPLVPLCSNVLGPVL